MRTAQEVIDTAVDDPPFSNGTEIYGWMENWCWCCHNPVEKAWRDYEDGKRKTQLKGYEGGCPMIMAAMIGKTPSEWIPQGREYFGDQYHCIEFRGPDDGRDPEPRPRPDPPGMDALFERPEPSVRMLAQPEQLVEATT